MKNGIIILSGYNIRAIIAFLRVCDCNKIPCFIIASNKNDPLFLTKYSSYISCIRDNNNVENIYDMATVIMRKEKLNIAYILPSTEYLNRYLLKNKNKFNENNILVPLIDVELYEKISNKLSFAQICNSNGIRVPHIYGRKEILKYPVILKAKSYDSYKGKPIKINCEEELLNFKLSNDFDNWFVQQYLQGSSYYLLYYIKKDGGYIMYSQQNFIQQENGASMIMAKSSDIHEMALSEKYIKLLKDNGFYGLIMIELRKHDNGYYMIEANPRLWGPSQLFVDSGVPLFENYLYDMGFDIDFNVLSNSNYNDSIYFWNEGVILSHGMETYYDYNKDNFIKDYDVLMKAEIFNRDDTASLFCQKRAYYDK